METNREILKISVRELVEFILRSGDIDDRISGRRETDSMLAGARIHRKIQKSMGADYHAEVSLKYFVPMGRFDLQIEGRADGIIEGDPVVVDEIKGICRSLEYLSEPVPVHLAQAKCYACIYGIQKKKEQMTVQLTYVNLDTEQKRYFQKTYSIRELREWFEDLIKEYQKWAEFRYEWKHLRNRTIHRLRFPYEYRTGQKELAGSVYRSILREKRLFIQAPTGTGKTLATMFPSLKAVGEGLGEKIFYLTAKTIAGAAADHCLELFRQQQLRLKSVVLTAKEKICVCEETDCNPESCPYAGGHFDRVNAAVFELLNSENDRINREILLEYAEKWKVCPFELSLDVSVWTDVIICDYNYVFDPRAHLKRFFNEGARESYLFLADEAHNLVERARSMYSARLCKEDFLELKRVLGNKAPGAERQLAKSNSYLLELKRECENYQILSDINGLYLQLLRLSSELQQFLEEEHDTKLKKTVMEFYLNLRSFLNTYEMLDDSYSIYTQMCEDGRFCLKLFCIQPAGRLKEYLKYGRSCVFFSATFLPIRYYKELLSGDLDDYAVYATSCFPEENQFVFIGTDVTSRYRRRGKAEYEKISRYIEVMLRSRPGNYLLFFPSYEMLGQVYEVFCQRNVSGRYLCRCQNPSMNEEEREEFLREFENEQADPLLGFCVMGGIFSEGIDLTEERLIGAVVIGTGLPKVCAEREILKKYFDEKGMNGFSYAYVYPGMNKVLQSAGRVIRTASDRGSILLLDERFAREEYQRLFPREWKQPVFGDLSVVEEKLRHFWEITLH